ncbi:hypothetical protein INR49_021973, partial [Caranx melampygus]
MLTVVFPAAKWKGYLAVSNGCPLSHRAFSRPLWRAGGPSLCAATVAVVRALRWTRSPLFTPRTAGRCSSSRDSHRVALGPSTRSCLRRLFRVSRGALRSLLPWPAHCYLNEKKEVENPSLPDYTSAKDQGVCPNLEPKLTDKMRLALHTVICCCVFTMVLPLGKGSTEDLNSSLKKRFKEWLQTHMKRDLGNILMTADEKYSDMHVGLQQGDSAKMSPPPLSIGLKIRPRRSTSKASGCALGTCRESQQVIGVAEVPRRPIGAASQGFPNTGEMEASDVLKLRVILDDVNAERLILPS